MKQQKKKIKLTLYDGINWAALLAITAVDTLCHINVISGCSSAAVFTFFGLNGNGLRGADGFAELAGDAAFLARGVST